jgi:hypothetical protein
VEELLVCQTRSSESLTVDREEKTETNRLRLDSDRGQKKTANRATCQKRCNHREDGRR